MTYFIGAATVFVLIAFEAPVSCTQLSVILNLSSHRVMEGGSLEVTCDVQNMEQKRLLVVWIRKTPSDNHEVEIGSNSFVNENFKRGGRYRSSVELFEPNDYRRVLFRLSIANVTSEDSGKIGCKLTVDNEKILNVSDFLVAVPVQNVVWMSAEPNSINKKHYIHGQQAQFIEGDSVWLICQVNGSYPKPQVRITLGETDVTSHFDQYDVLVRGEGPPGLQSMYYKVDVYNKAMAFDYSYNDKFLKCTSSLFELDLPNSVAVSSTQRVSSIRITLLYKPKIECDSVVQVRINEPNFSLLCKVYSNPEVKLAKIYWNHGRDVNDTVEEVKKHEDYFANITMINEVETLMVLTINRVYLQHFKTYLFEVENDIGRVVREVSLERVTSCVAERSFSALRRLKTWLRNSMTQDRLNTVAVCHIHRHLLDTVDLHTLYFSKGRASTGLRCTVCVFNAMLVSLLVTCFGLMVADPLEYNL